MIVIICAKYKKNPSRTVDATERTRFSKSRPNDLEDIKSRSRVITYDTPSHAIDHLYQIWKKSILKCRCYRGGGGGGAVVKSLQLIWKWVTCQLHRQVRDLQISCSDLTPEKNALILLTRPISRRQNERYTTTTQRHERYTGARATSSTYPSL